MFDMSNTPSPFAGGCECWPSCFIEAVESQVFDDQDQLFTVFFIGSIAGFRQAFGPGLVIVGRQFEQVRVAFAGFEKLAVGAVTPPDVVVFDKKVFVRVVGKIHAVAFFASFGKTFDTQIFQDSLPFSATDLRRDWY